MKKRTIGVAGVALGLLVGAVVSGAAQSGDRRSRLDVLVAGALRNADGLFLRAENLTAKAGRYGASKKTGRPTPKWFSLVRSAKRTYRVAYLSLHKYRKVALSADLKKLYDRVYAESRKRLVEVLEALIAEYAVAGNRPMVARLIGELKRVDAAAAAKLKPLARGAVPRRTGRGGGLSGGRLINPRRAGHRLTGAEARWLARRGYNPGGRSGSGGLKGSSSRGGGGGGTFRGK